MMDERKTSRTPDWLLERYARGELPAARAEEIRARLGAEPDGAARLQALRDSDREILERHSPREMAASILARAATSGSRTLQLEAAATGIEAGSRQASDRGAIPLGAVRRGRARPVQERLRFGWALGLAAPVAAAILVVAITSGPPPVAPDAPDTIRMKGLAPGLVVHRKAGADAETLTDGAGVRAHDVLQLAYVAAGRSFGVIVSLDGGGAVTLHLPLSGAVAAPLDAQGATPLPQAYELDDAPGFERFVLVASDSPFEVGAVLAAARARATSANAPTSPLSLPAELEQTSVVVRKIR